MYKASMMRIMLFIQFEVVSTQQEVSVVVMCQYESLSCLSVIEYGIGIH